MPMFGSAITRTVEAGLAGEESAGAIHGYKLDEGVGMSHKGYMS